MNVFDLYKTKKDRKELAELFRLAASTNQQRMLPDFFYEKDLWITECLHILFDRQLLSGYRVAFKGGTALSKCWSAISRFSEDIDLSVHWSDLYGISDAEYDDAWQKTTKSRSQNDRFRTEQHQRLIAYATALTTNLNEVLAAYEIPELAATLNVDNVNVNIEVRYPHVTGSGKNYQLDYILLEFGGRNRGCPTQAVPVQPYLSFLPLNGLDLPSATPDAYDIGYITWEKLTALHQFCTQTKIAVAKRQARHWYDVCSLMSKDLIDPINQLDAMNDVIVMKSSRWAISGVDYHSILKGGLKLVPDAGLYNLIKQDHLDGIAGGLFFDAPPSFDEIMDTLRQLESKINNFLSGK